jgi:hypothetical protein
VHQRGSQNKQGYFVRNGQSIEPLLVRYSRHGLKACIGARLICIEN